MSDHTPKTMGSERLADFMAGLRDGQIRVDAEGDRLSVAVKCSHVEDGACAECLVPLLGTLAKALEESASLRAEVEELKQGRQDWRDFAVRHPEITPPAVGSELSLLDRKCRALTAEVARLTEERDALSAAYRDAGIERDSAQGRAADAESDLSDARALADRLAEALVEARTRLDDEAEALCWCHMPPGFHDPACVAARAALREWEEARRG